jgi:hypothetical protein
VPVSPTDLLAPKGEVTSSLFPGEDAALLETRLEGYIDEGEARSSDEDAVLAWAYYRVYHAVYVRLTTTASTVSFADQGSHSFLMTQIENVGRLRDQYLQQFRDITVQPAGETTRESRTSTSRIDFTW